MSDSDTLLKPGLSYEAAGKAFVNYLKAWRTSYKTGEDIVAAIQVNLDAVGSWSNQCVEIKKYLANIGACVTFMIGNCSVVKREGAVTEILRYQPLSIITNPYMQTMFKFLDVQKIDKGIGIIGVQSKYGLMFMNLSGIEYDLMSPRSLQTDVESLYRRSLTKPSRRAVAQFLETVITPYRKDFDSVFSKYVTLANINITSTIWPTQLTEDMKIRHVTIT